MDGEWAKLRQEVLSRDTHQCVNCGSSEELEVHHVVPINDFGTNKKSNLATLCSRCHYSAHSKESAGDKKDRPKNVRWTPSRVDMSNFINSVQHPLKKAIASTVVKTGIGVGELCNLTVDDVYLTKEWTARPFYQERPDWLTANIAALRVRNSSADQNYNIRRDREHNSVIPIDNELHQALAQWMALRPDAHDSQPFFMSTSNWGDPLSPDSIHHIIESSAKPLGMHNKGQELENLTPYTLRHFFIERFRGKATVREYILGHFSANSMPLSDIASHYQEEIFTIT
ncbi:HNH endonuclease [Halalkalicoccus jeotgali]|nr:HNH endonuclease [Halalkalicoccus jeotgali]